MRKPVFRDMQNKSFTLEQTFRQVFQLSSQRTAKTLVRLRVFVGHIMEYRIQLLSSRRCSYWVMYQTSPIFPTTVTPDQYDHIHMNSKSKTHSSYLSVKMHLQN